MENGQELHEHKETPRTRPLRVYVFGLLFIAGVAAVTLYIVKTQRRPGQMNLIESQAMDMKAMKAPVGSTPVSLETLEIKDFEPRVTYSGSVVPYSEEEVFPRVEGWIDDMPVYAGDTVTAGQIVARLSSPDVTQRSKAAQADSDASLASAYAAQAEAAAADASVSAAEDEVDQMRQMVTIAEAELKSMKADREYRDSELARMKRLYDSGAISKSEYEQERAMNTGASADVDKAEAEVEAARRRLDGAKKQEQSMRAMARARNAQVTAASAMSRAGAARASAENITAEYLNVRSRLDGVVTERLVAPGTLARPGVPIFRIADISRVRLQANVSESDAARIRAGYSVVVTTPRKPGKTFEASVTTVFPASNTTTRTAVVEAVIENNGRVFLPGDFVSMAIGTGESDTALSVPENAVVRWGSGGKPAVWTAVSGGAKGETLYTCVMHPEIIRKKPGDCPKCNMALVKKKAEGDLTAHLVQVELGPSNGDRVKIVRGLHPGDQVVVDGGGDLAEGEALHQVKWGSDGPETLPPPPGTGSGHSGHGGDKGTKKEDHSQHNMPGM